MYFPASPKTPTKSSVESSSIVINKINNNKSIYYGKTEYRKICFLCGHETSDKCIFEHYLVKHPNHEVFISRLSPDYAEKSKSLPPNPRYNERLDLEAICYFCETEKTASLHSWANHILMHTGEKNYICHNHKTPNKKVSSAHRTTCGERCEMKFEYKFKNNLLSAFICEKCNFVQTQKVNIEKHLTVSHNLKKNESLGKYYREIQLVSIQMCNPVKLESIENENIADTNESMNENSANESVDDRQSTASPIQIEIHINPADIKQENESVRTKHMNELDESGENLNQSIFERINANNTINEGKDYNIEFFFFSFFFLNKLMFYRIFSNNEFNRRATANYNQL